MRQFGRYTGVATGMMVGASLAMIVGVSAHGGDTTLIHACVGQSGGVRIVEASGNCKQNEAAVDFQGPKGDKGDAGVQGPKGDQGDPGLQGHKGDKGDTGAAGTFSGVFASPNQAYSLSVTDSGIEMAGPLGLVRVTGSGVEMAGPTGKVTVGLGSVDVESDFKVNVRSGAVIDIKSDAIATIEGSAFLDLRGGAVLVNGSVIP